MEPQQAISRKTDLNDIFEDNIGEDFLSSWKQTGGKRDASSGTGNVNSKQSKQKNFSLNNFDMEFNFDGGLGAFSTFKVDMDGLDFLSSSSKKQKPKASRGDNLAVEKKQMDDDDFKFDFDFKKFDFDCNTLDDNEEKVSMDNINLPESPSENIEESHRSKNLSGTAEKSSAGSKYVGEPKKEDGFESRLSEVTKKLVESPKVHVTKSAENAPEEGKAKVEHYKAYTGHMLKTANLESIKSFDSIPRSVTQRNIYPSQSTSLNVEPLEVVSVANNLHSNVTPAIVDHECAREFPDRSHSEIVTETNSLSKKSCAPETKSPVFDRRMYTSDEIGNQNLNVEDSVSATMSGDSLNKKKSIDNPVKCVEERNKSQFRRNSKKKSVEGTINGSSIVTDECSKQGKQYSKQTRSGEPNTSTTKDTVECMKEEERQSHDLEYGESDSNRDFEDSFVSCHRKKLFREQSSADSLPRASNVISIEKENSSISVPQKHSIKHPTSTMSSNEKLATNSELSKKIHRSREDLTSNYASLNGTDHCKEKGNVHTTLLSSRKRKSEESMTKPIEAKHSKGAIDVSHTAQNSIDHNDHARVSETGFSTEARLPNGSSLKSQVNHSCLFANSDIEPSQCENTALVEVEATKSVQRADPPSDGDLQFQSCCSSDHANLLLNDGNTAEKVNAALMNLEKLRKILGEKQEAANKLLARVILSKKTLYMQSQHLVR